MTRACIVRKLSLLFVGVAFLGGLAACSGLDAPPATGFETGERPVYVVGPGDSLDVFVWGQPDLSRSIVVRPDGRLTLPLVTDLVAAGKTPSELSAAITEQLKTYVQNPVVSVMVVNFAGPFDKQVRVVGEAATPKALQYRDRMTTLDAMIEVGGLKQFAAGNRAVLVRGQPPEAKSYRVRLEDLMNDGDINANVPLMPGDVLIIPQSWF
ncbi:sugar ABC transporter substrate-binding protein [Rhodospirillum rubrum]|nr:XrtA/PEP-CTERM system exopolysaccharide export protein [Rhodospirillum rubrum]MBK1666358.1 sugar ABC transporter substrate-binding protein [Rhodospirillum rubrum]MBK1678547.1 sugar ABC transporter substrate-binding protein [Rhodospirillum rubrum]